MFTLTQSGVVRHTHTQSSGGSITITLPLMMPILLLKELTLVAVACTRPTFLPRLTSPRTSASSLPHPEPSLDCLRMPHLLAPPDQPTDLSQQPAQVVQRTELSRVLDLTRTAAGRLQPQALAQPLGVRMRVEGFEVLGFRVQAGCWLLAEGWGFWGRTRRGSESRQSVGRGQARGGSAACSHPAPMCARAVTATQSCAQWRMRSHRPKPQT